MDDNEFDQINDGKKQQTTGKKSKKDRRKKKNDDDDEDLDALLAELHMEIVEGKKPSVVPSTSSSSKPIKSDDTITTETNNNHVDNMNDKKSTVNQINNDDNDEKSQTKYKKNKKKKDNKKVTNQSTQESENVQQKNNQNDDDDNKTGDKMENVDKNNADKSDNDDGDDDDGDTGTSKNKDKKKKRKEAKKKKQEEQQSTGTTKASGKGPGKKQIALMQEILKKQREEEERQQREEEERIRLEEERERQREEKERLEKERKEKKKQKEKERKLRLKKEGKLLTAKQKADRQRAQLNLQLLKESGQAVIGKTRKEGRLDKQDSQDDESKSDNNLSEPKDDDNTEPLDDIEMVNDDDVDEEDEFPDDWENIVIEDRKKKQQQQQQQKAIENKKSSNNKSVNNSQTTSTTKSIDPDLSLSTSNPASRPPEKFRSPIICVLGHVDTGKTKLLDYIRKSHIQDNEAGGITQQIGATFVPPTAIQEQCKNVKQKTELKIPGLLIIDTPGHESFSNLRSRGSSLCDIAILVIDIMHGLEKQTIESLNLLKSRKTPFVVALNKIDRLYEWRSNVRKDVEDLVNSQLPNVKHEFNTLKQKVIVQLAEQSINAALFYENPDPRTYISLIPTSAHTGDGMGNLINLITHFTQTLLAKRINYVLDSLDATVLEVKAIPGLGTTIDVVLVNGKLREGDKIVLAGHDGPIVTQIRALLVPQPLKELRVKSPYEELRIVYGSVGVKIAAHDLEKAVAGLNLYVAHNETELERLKTMCWSQFGSAMKAIKCSDKGVYVQASTLGALEALLEFLKDSKIPYSGVRIGPIAKRDVMKASIMLEHSPDNAVILAFDVKIDRDAQELADQLGVKIFMADIIYHLFDQFTAYKENLRKQRKEQNRHLAVFPCKLRILPNCIFNKRDPIVLGVHVEDGTLVPGTPLSVPTKDLDIIGRVTTIEHDHKTVEQAKRGDEICIKIEHCTSDAPKLYGRHFDSNDLIYSRITRDSIDIMKEHFRDDLEKSDWQLMIELKKIFNIV
uniref:Eukaryotic translation initiation factor 5B n=1 Tax=Dermatophagoides pteronyssinus TaxID=6956 RepID=A0A6P6YLV8_DERPT|nr:eukaryotic translation initiation factor 5B-like [Dermatophagoides pteronyssinus]